MSEDTENKHDGECPHPARSGHHEVYGRPNGTSFCRACGAEFGSWSNSRRRANMDEG